MKKQKMKLLKRNSRKSVFKRRRRRKTTGNTKGSPKDSDSIHILMGHKQPKDWK